MKHFIFFVALATMFLTACNTRRTVLVDFDRVDGLYKGAKISRQGIEVGTVENMKVADNGKIRVTCGIKCNKLYSESTVFKLKSTDFLGTKSIDVIPGSGEAAASGFVFKGEIEEDRAGESSNGSTRLALHNLAEYMTKQDSILNELKKLNARIEVLEKSKK